MFLPNPLLNLTPAGRRGPSSSLRSGRDLEQPAGQPEKPPDIAIQAEIRFARGQLSVTNRA